MKYFRLLLVAAAALWLTDTSVSAAPPDEPSASDRSAITLRPLDTSDRDDIRDRLPSGQLGLKPQSGARNGSGLPFGLSYHSEMRGLLVPMDDQNTLGLGIGLNIGGTRNLDSLTGGGLGLQLKGSPGIIFEKKF